MRTIGAAVVCVVCAAGGASCGGRGGTTATPRRPPRPAVTWSTELPPYRLPAGFDAMWVDDARAVIAVGPGVIAAVDLATGAVTSKRTDGIRGTTDAIARLADGRVVVAMTHDDQLRMYQVGADLGLTLVREEPDDWSDVAIAVATDGQVALSAAGHQLDLYAADGVSVTRTLGPPAVGWGALFFADRGRRLLGRQNGTLYSFDVATGTMADAGMGSWLGASNGTTALAAVGDSTLVVIDLTTMTVTSELATDPRGVVAALSPDGTRAARLDATSVMIHDTASKAVIARWALGPSQVYGGHVAFTPSGERLVIVTGATVRVVELATGAMSSAGPGPYRSPTFLAVTRDHVVAGADRVWRWPIGGGVAEVIGADEPDVTDGAVSPSGTLIAATRTLPDAVDGTTNVEVTLWRDGGEPGRWLRHDSIASVAVDDDGEVMIGAWKGRAGDVVGRNVIDVARDRGRWKRMVEIHYDSYIDAIDASTRLAAVSSAGDVRVIQLPGIAPVSSATIPSCDGSGNVHLDGAGKRIATDDDKTLWIWDISRRSARRIGAGGFDSRIGEVVFIPGRSEVAMDLDDRVAVWDYAANRATSVRVDGIIGRVALDPDGTRVAIGMTSGRIHVITLADLRAGTPETITAGADDAACSKDPLARPEHDYDAGRGRQNPVPIPGAP